MSGNESYYYFSVERNRWEPTTQATYERMARFNCKLLHKGDRPPEMKKRIKYDDFAALKKDKHRQLAKLKGAKL